MTTLGLLVGGLLAGLVALAGLSPTARRLAARNVRRRGGDALLVVLGCAVGAAVVTSALAVADSLDASARARVPGTLGPVDVVVRSYSEVVVETAESFLESSPPEDSDGLLRVVTAGATLTAPGEDGRKVLPSARLMEAYFDEARAFGGDPDATGISGPTPEYGEVALGRDAAEELGVRAGASVEVHAYGESRKLRVVRVLPRRGIAGYATEFDDGSMNAFVAPGAITELAFTGFYEEAAPPDNLLFVSAEGGVFTDAARSGALLDQVQRRLRDVEGSEADPVKAELLREAREQGDEFAELFLSLGAFAVLAGAALLVNTLVMLGEERRRELGVLRSMGMKRRTLVAASVLEGGAYAAAATLLGVLAGIGAAFLAVRLAGGVFSSATRGGVEAMRFGLEAGTPLIGALAGLAVSLLVVAMASLRTATMPVMEAIRDLPAGRSTRPPRTWTLAASALASLASAIASGLALGVGNDLGSLALPCVALASSAAFVGAEARRRPPGERPGGPARGLVVDGAAIAAMLWVVLAFPLLGLDGDDALLFVVQGLVLALAAVALAVRHRRALGPVLGRAGGGYGIALRLAFAYPADRRLRTGTTLLACALIVFTLVFSSVLSETFSEGEERLAADEGGGYDLLVTAGSGDPVGAKKLENVAGVQRASSLAWTVAGFRVGGSGVFEDWAISGFDRAFVEGGPPKLEAFDRARYPDEAAVWRAVLEDPGLAVADAAFLESGGGPPEDNVAVGNRIGVKAPETGETAERRVVAISAGGAAFSGVMVSERSFDALFDGSAGDRHYVAVSEGSDPGAVASEVQRRFLENGLEARPFAEVIGEALRGQEAFFDLIEGYLALGLLIGISGLGISAIRAVRERRRTVGVLRALGLPARMVRVALLAESGLVALVGALIGTVLALATGYGLVTNSDAFGDVGTAFAVPWVGLVLLVAGVLVASLLVALPSAVGASRIPPATALRAVGEDGV